MIDPEKTNDYFVKLTGKGNIESPLEIGHNYELRAKGTITSFTESDKNDGSHTIFYKYEPVNIELVDDLGEAIRAKDTRSYSQLFRARMWKQWQNAQSDLSFEDWYGRLMQRLIQDADTIGEMYGS
jgi:hypothetical protein